MNAPTLAGARAPALKGRIAFCTVQCGAAVWAHIHFTVADDLPHDLIGSPVASMPVDRWVEIAQAARRR